MHALDGELGPVAERIATGSSRRHAGTTALLGRGIYIVQSLQGVRGQGKGIGASRLTSPTCSFYAGVNAAAGPLPQ
jgi:hypothetical protein